MRWIESAIVAILSSPAPSRGFAPSVSPSAHRNLHGLPMRGCLLRQKCPLFGIMDEINSDAYDLVGKTKAATSISAAHDVGRAYEVFLAELVFSPNDPRLDIVEKIHLAGDPEFLDWLQGKAAKSTDPEERMALRDLHGMILDVKQKIELSAQAEERVRKEADDDELRRMKEKEEGDDSQKAMSNTDVLRQAAKVDTAGIAKTRHYQSEERIASGENKKSFLESEISPEIRMSYEGLLEKLLPPYNAGDTVSKIVSRLYEQCDAQLMRVLEERAMNGDKDSQAVLDAIGTEQAKRLSLATDHLKEVLAMGEPMKMEGSIVRLAREQKIDEPFLLLLEANANQAEAAGAKGPAELMRRLKNRALEEKDKNTQSKEIKLLRRLLRTDDSAERERLLEDAFTPREKLLVQGTVENASKALDGEAPEEEQPMPDVPPPNFINACKAVLLNFGNLGTDKEGNLSTRVRAIASEAEIVATRIFGKGMTSREQQDRMYKDHTTSIFDLETMEIESERMGANAPWSNPDNDDILPGFDKDGKMRVGGK